MSIGMGLTFVPLTLIGTTNIDDADAGLASGVFNTSQQVGGALGLAVSRRSRSSRTSDVLGGLGHAPTPSDRSMAVVEGFHVAFTAGSVLIGLGAIGLAVLIRRATWPASTRASRPWPPRSGVSLVDAVNPQAEPALRADAQRNRRRILDAAAEAFSEGGLDVGVAEIARRAGVGAGTLFRRFPTKEDLIFAIIEERTLELIAAGREALAQEDAALALREFMFAGVEMHVRDQGFFDAVVSRVNKEERLRELRDEMVEIAGELLERGQADGAVRDDLEPPDLPLLMCAAASAAAPVHGALPDLWRRYVGLILDGLRPRRLYAARAVAPTLADFDAALSEQTRARRAALGLSSASRTLGSGRSCSCAGPRLSPPKAICSSRSTSRSPATRAG